MEIATDFAAEAARHRNVAEEYRTMALHAPDHGLRGVYQRLANDYDALADNEDRIARNLKISN